MKGDLLLLPPLPAGGGGGGGGIIGGTERALEEAAATGRLSLAGRRLRAFPAAAAKRWDLSDTTQADLSRNRFGEVPEAALALVALEGLSLAHNCLRSLSPGIANLQGLVHLDLSRNQLRSLPPGLCLLPLRVLNASNNHLGGLPENLGALGTLRQLDVSGNELQALPPGLGQLKALRDLNLRRNQLTLLPPELAELPLVRLDFSCNRVVSIPRCYRRLRHLQVILTDNNPLQSPPAQICQKGKVHIFKYLQAEPTTRPPPTCLTDELCPPWHRGGLDSGFNSVDTGSKRWSGNESTDEFSEPSRQLRERRSGAGDSDPEQLDSIEGSVAGEETPPEEQQGLSPRGDTPERVAGGRLLPLPRRRPQRLQLWQEREKSRGGEPRESFQRAAPRPPPTSSHSDPGPSPQRQPRMIPGLDEAPPPPPRPTSSPSRAAATKPAPKPHKTPQDPEERELIAEMRQSIESLLQLHLPQETLSDRELLSRLLAHLAPQKVKPPPPQHPPPGLLAGFALFYALLMALLFTTYRALLGS